MYVPERQNAPQAKRLLQAPPADEGTVRPRTAGRIAAEMEQCMADAGLSAGDRIGREADLAVEFGVSRWTMREALAQLMQAGAIEARRGGNGGLYVAAPAPEVVRNNIVSYLESVRVEAHDIVVTRLALARLFVDKAASGLPKASMARMRALVDQSHGGEGEEAVAALVALQAEMVRAGRNPVLELLYTCFSDLLVHAAWLSSLDDDAFGRRMRTLREDRQAMIEALLAGDRERALALEGEFGEVFEAVYRSSALITGKGLPQARMRAQTMFPAFRLGKKTEQVAWALREAIAQGGWSEGMSLGSESDLMARYAIGRATLREAVRSLERVGLVRMAHGGGGGLKVISPDAAPIVAGARRYLHMIAAKPAMLKELHDVLLPVVQEQPGNRVATLFLQIVDAA